MKSDKLKKIEIALLMALCITLCYGTYINAAKENLSQNVIRFHVIASSDDEAEQELKLRVKEPLVTYLEKLLENTETAAEAKERIEEQLPEIESLALSLSEGRSVAVLFGTNEYPIRSAEGYTLPAGEYTSLRVVLGEGDGQNWWGVIFPDLTPDAVAAVQTSALNEKGVSLISDDEDGVSIKFKAIEYFDGLKRFFSQES